MSDDEQIPETQSNGHDRALLATLDEGVEYDVDALNLPDPLFETWQRLLKNVASVPEHTMRVAIIDRTIRELMPEQGVWCLDQLIRGALWGQEAAVDAMLAASRWLIRLRSEDDYEFLQTLYQEAHSSERQSVLALLRDPPAHRALRKGGRLPEIRLPQMGREVTAGEKRALAVGRDFHILERLLLDPNPLVLQKLLTNPTLRLQDAMVVATRRPTTPELLFELVDNEKWFRELEVRMALVQNPYLPTGHSLKILPTLNIHALRRLAHAGDLHPAISEFADRLVKLREERTAPWRV